MTEPLPIIDPARTEFGAQRTKCACFECTIHCKFQPGYLIPGDIERIHKHVAPDLTREAFAEKYLDASRGATVMIVGCGETNVPTLVPQAKEDGTCIFLGADDRCTIHEVSPFGCAFFDSHQTEADGSDLSNKAIRGLMGGTLPGTLEYNSLLQHLRQTGHIAPSPSARKERMRQSRIVKFDPETLAQLQARFPQALAKPLDLAVAKEADAPGFHRENTFDFHDGLRVCASIDVGADGGDFVVPHLGIPLGRKVLHLSAMAMPNTELEDAYKRAMRGTEQTAAEWFVAAVAGRLLSLTNYSGTLYCLGAVSRPHVIHWMGSWPVSI